MTSRGRSQRRAGRTTVTGSVVPPGTIPSRYPGQLTGEERRRLALVALGELVLKVQEREVEPDAPRPTGDV